jgi:phospholipid/cholesterol/gamma-HCH transport system permease protein
MEQYGVRGGTGIEFGTGASTRARPDRLLSFFTFFGIEVFRLMRALGSLAIFLFLALVSIFRRNQISGIVAQVFHIGARSSLIVMLVGLFTGMVLGLQLFYTLVKFGSVGALGSAVSLSLVRELGPVLTAIMITARAGSAMSAEIGIMRISEQIDALYTMRIDPIRYLISPRIAASIISFPLLTAFFDLIGMIGGYIASVVLLGTSGGTYLYRISSSLDISDIRGGFIKSIVFAVVVSAICCFQGYYCHTRKNGHGAKAVGLATISGVVLSCVMILIADYVVTSFLM